MSDWSQSSNVKPEVRNAVEWGKKLERERIIALLDSLKCNCDGECGMVEAPFTVLERLIKGENE